MWRSAAKKFREKRPERVREINRNTQRRRREKYPDLVRMLARQRKAKRDAIKKGATGVDDFVDYHSIIERDGMICHICGLGIADGNLHFDHVIPLSRGGAHSMVNIRPSHAACNISKGAKLMEQLI